MRVSLDSKPDRCDIDAMKKQLRELKMSPGWAVAFAFLGLGIVLKFVVLVMTVMGIR